MGDWRDYLPAPPPTSKYVELFAITNDKIAQPTRPRIGRKSAAKALPGPLLEPVWGTLFHRQAAQASRPEAVRK